MACYVVAVYDEGLAMGIVEGIRACYPKMKVSYFTDAWKDAARMEFEGEDVYGVVFDDFGRRRDSRIFFDLLDGLESSGQPYRLFEDRSDS